MVRNVALWVCLVGAVAAGARAEVRAAAAAADPVPLYVEPVVFKAQHDPSVIDLADGRRLPVSYDGVAWKTVFDWKPGRAMQLTYDGTRGLRLVDVATGAWLMVTELPGEHPIDRLERDGRGVSTIQLRRNQALAGQRWDQELKRANADVLAHCTPAQAAAFRESQQRFAAFYEAQREAIFALYAGAQGNAWQLEEAIQITEIIRSQALRMARLRSVR